MCYYFTIYNQSVDKIILLKDWSGLVELNKKIVVSIMIILFVYLVSVVGVYLNYSRLAHDFAATERSTASEEFDCTVSFDPRGGSTDSWSKAPFEGTGNQELTGTIYNITFRNNSGFDVTDWNLRLNIHDDCFINNSWCGTIEFHQNSNGKELIQTLDLREFEESAITINHVMDGQDLMIPLKDGDYIIYNPNGNDGEAPIVGIPGTPTTAVAGIILYKNGGDFDLSDISAVYHLRKPVLSSQQIPLFVGLAFIWAVLVISFLTLIITTHFTQIRIKEQEATIDSALGVFSGFVDAKDPYTKGHSERVAKYTYLLSLQLGLSKKQSRNNYYIALLHDCGKCYIPDSILKKPAELDSEEYEIIKTHTTHGADLLKDFTAIANIQDGAHYHHERFDGTGFPSQLAGEDIPFIARIIAVADSFDAMNSNRIHRAKLGADKIMKELKEGRGTQFDPVIVDAFIKLLYDGKIEEFNPVYTF